MNVLLVNCPLGWNVERGINDQPPMGLLYILEYIKNSSLQVNISLFDPVVIGLGVNEAYEELMKKDFDILGLNVTTPLFNIVRTLVTKLKQKRNILCILGGPHATLLPEETLDKTGADIVVMGEGEKTLYEILSNLIKKQSLSSVLGIAFKDQNNIIVTECRSFHDNLNALPFPFLDNITISRYSGISKKAYIISSRGCPQDCIFCSTPVICGRKWRYRSTANIVEEINYYVTNYGAEEIHFLDDNFTAHKNRLLEFCKNVAPIKVRWRALSRIGLSDEILSNMKRSGCYKLSFGVESGNDEILRKIKKRILIEDARRNLATCKLLGISTKVFFMIGFPFERIEHIVSSINLAVEFADAFGAKIAFNIVKPYPGSRLMSFIESMPDFRLIQPDSSLSDEEHKLVKKFGDFPYPSINPYFSTRDLMTFIETAYKCCLSRKKISVAALLAGRGVAASSLLEDFDSISEIGARYGY